MAAVKKKKKKATRKKTAVVKATPVERNGQSRRRGRNEADERLQKLRDEMWPTAADLVWSRHRAKGFGTIPRLLPLITALMRELSPARSGDPSAVYIELWARVRVDGYVQITNPADNAFAAGYTGTRAVRSWTERMRLLEDLGFIRTKPNGVQEFGHVLIPDPLRVAARLRAKAPSRVPDEWWIAFQTRASEIGAVIPDL